MLSPITSPSLAPLSPANRQSVALRPAPVQPLAPQPPVEQPVAEQQPLLTEFTVDEPSALRTGVVGMRALQYQRDMAEAFIAQNLAVDPEAASNTASNSNDNGSLLNPSGATRLYASVQRLSEQQ